MKQLTFGVICFGLATALGTTAASAAPILLFQTDALNGVSVSRTQFGIATRISVSASTNLTNIGVELDLAAPTDSLNYFIFNSSTGALLFQTGPQVFADNGMTFKVSNAFAFVLNPGIVYAIGAETLGTADYAFVTPGGKTQNGITSLGQNQNATGFLNPVLNLNLNSTDGELQLYTDAAAVPEPATLSLLGIGVAGLYARRRRTARV
jgi:hypothetical protein